MRHIRQIFTALTGEPWSNQRLLTAFEPLIERLPASPEERDRLRDFVRFQLVGARSRRCVAGVLQLDGFASRASAFEAAADQALDALAAQIVPAAECAGISFDAVIGTTSTGNLMPGLSYRLARRLVTLARADCVMLDFGNVGCTGSILALNVARALEERFRNILIVAFEAPSTLVNTKSASFDTWQGNCTFGDGAAAVWVSCDSGTDGLACAIENIRCWQRSGTGLDLIRWGYGDYYGFAMGDEKTFDRDVRQFVVDALAEAENEWRNASLWAIHPAGIVLLARISRKLGIPHEAIQPSVASYRENSNMSSASILHILKEVAANSAPGSTINLLTMGAGFSVIYGRLRRVGQPKSNIL